MIELNGFKMRRDGNKLIFEGGEATKQPAFVIGETVIIGGGSFRVVDYGPSMIRVEPIDNPREVKTYLA